MSNQKFPVTTPFQKSILSAMLILFPLLSIAQTAEFMDVCEEMKTVVRSQGYTIVESGYVDAIGYWDGEITSGEFTVNSGEHYNIVMIVDQCGDGCTPYVVWQEWGQRYEIASDTHSAGSCKWVVTVVNDDDWSTGELLGGVESETSHPAYMIVARGSDAMYQPAASYSSDTFGITELLIATASVCCVCVGTLLLLTLL